MLLEAAFSLVASVLSVFSVACTIVTSIRNADRSKRNTGKDKETAMHLNAKRAQKLKSLQKRMDKMHKEKLGLVESMDKAMDTLGSKMLVLMLTYGTGSIILLRNYPYAGIRVLILMLVLYFYIVKVVFTPAFGRIKETKQLVQDLQRRQIELQNDVVYLKVKIEQLKSDCKSYNTKNLNTHGVQNGIGSLNSRIAKLQKAASEILEISKFEDELNLLFKVAIEFGISFPIIAYFVLRLFW
ncbi:hypothetical protein F0562_013966 [Nyssa sinensis]|uniref:Uncharacterized protein n=1 Tax=Nyssa sinensis TaxID=561372 RepID=A0A5J4ZM30_9ASTE|nr:hypothetical protein F0562_013966 [Nyssa sinensis]